MRYLLLLSTLVLSSCATIHFRSDHTVPVTFEGNGHHQQEVLVEGERNFYWWGTNPEFHEVFVDAELKKAGIKSLSKAIIYEQKDPQDILISFLTFGIYMPRGWSITGYTEGGKGPLKVYRNEE